MALREAIAAVLGIALGVFFIAAPAAVVRAYTMGRTPPGRRGEYGSDGDLPASWRRLVRVLGLALVAAGAYFGWQALAVV